MSNIQKIINGTDENDKKIEELKREVESCENELTFLISKKESKNSIRLFLVLSEIFGWMLSVFNILFFIENIRYRNNTLYSIKFEVLIILLTLIFRYFKSIHTVKNETIQSLENRIFSLRLELGKASEEKIFCINNVKMSESRNRNFDISNFKLRLDT